MERLMKYEDWEVKIPPEIKADALWQLEVYRLALFLGDIGWYDVSKLFNNKRTFSLADHLYRSLGSVSANIAEGFSRSSSKDQARFYEYALGSARESRDWYFKARYVLGEQVTNHRLEFLTQIIRLLLTMIPQKRGRSIRESQAVYSPDALNKEIPMP